MWCHRFISKFDFYSQEYCYSRAGNPTRDALEKCLAALDNGKHGLAFASGCAATTAVLHLLKTGDHMISSDETYGGTQAIFKHNAESMGIEIDFVDSRNTNAVKMAIKSNTRVKTFEILSFFCLRLMKLKLLVNLD